MKIINFLKNLSKKRIAVGALFFNNKGELLILRTSYKKGWTIPGGIVEIFESPKQALLREIEEEIGFKLKIIRCVAIDYRTEKYKNYNDESLQLLFLGKKLNKEDAREIKIDGKEIIEYKFVKLKEAIRLVSPRLAARIKQSMKNINSCIYLENGEKVL